MRKRTLRILSIDDNEAVVASVARYFSVIGGHMVWGAAGGRAGLEKAARLLPDFILLDLNMPDMGGVEVLAALCGNPSTRKIPVIILTGEDTAALQETLKGYSNFLRLEEKPGDLGRILREMERLAEQVQVRESRDGTLPAR